MNQKHGLVYFAYGKREIIYECIYSIMSLLRVEANPEAYMDIFVYTDQPELFAVFPKEKVHVSEINPKQIQQFKGPYDFVFRPKIEILRHVSQKRQGKILYCDSDIYFLQSPRVLFEKISSEAFLMCNYEEKVGERPLSNVRKRYLDFIKTEKALLQTQGLEISPHTPMWNAGVLGFFAEDKAFLDDVLQTTDLICSKFYSHITEQLAFSYHFAKHREIAVTDGVLLHYWNFKEFRAVLSEFFDYHSSHASTLEQILSDLECIRPDVLSKPKRAYEALAFWPKALQKLKGKNRWKIPPYVIGQGNRLVR